MRKEFDHVSLTPKSFDSVLFDGQTIIWSQAKMMWLDELIL